MNAKHILLLSGLLLGSSIMYAQDYEDIYYNPKKDKKETQNKPATSAASTQYELEYRMNPDGTYTLVEYGVEQPGSYLLDDTDIYNRVGDSYYVSAIDTIGNGIANSEDFTYTRMLQKYYNPTIIVDNSALLADVLNNAYGNVNIVYTGGVPSFGWWDGYWPGCYPGYYSTWGGWGWSVGFSPWYYPGYYPGYAYYPWGWNGWGWGWGGWYPGGWGWDWAWGPSYGGGYTRPVTNPTIGAGSGWAHSTRPGATTIGTRPGMSTRPGLTSTTTATTRPGMSTRPSSTTVARPGVSANSGFNSAGHRIGTTGTSTSARPSVNTGTISTRPATTTTTRPSSTSTRPSTTTTPSRSSYNSGSTYSRPSSGGSYSRPSGGASSSGGFRSAGGGGGRHR